MKLLAFAVASLLTAAAVNAQIYQWKDEKGRTIISDKPPAGSVTQTRTIESNSSAASPEKAKTIADRDLEFRKRLDESKTKAEADKKAESEAAAKKDNCERAQRHLQVLQSGERIAMRDDKGERYFMDDAQRQQEVTKTQEAIQASCGK